MLAIADTTAFFCSANSLMEALFEFLIRRQVPVSIFMYADEIIWRWLQLCIKGIMRFRHLLRFIKIKSLCKTFPNAAPVRMNLSSSAEMAFAIYLCGDERGLFQWLIQILVFCEEYIVCINV